MVLEKPGDPLKLLEKPDPVPGPGEVLVKVSACGVCRTDLHVIDGDLTEPKLPIIPGHEIVGTVSGLGEGVVFGEDNVAMAEVLTPELRAGMPEDLGRSKVVGWYGILQFGLIWTTANAGQARVVHVASS